MFIVIAVIILIIAGCWVASKIVSVNKQDENTSKEEIADKNS